MILNEFNMFLVKNIPLRGAEWVNGCCQQCSLAVNLISIVVICRGSVRHWGFFFGWFHNEMLFTDVATAVKGSFHCGIRLLVVAGLFSVVIEVKKPHGGQSLLLSDVVVEIGIGL